MPTVCSDDRMVEMILESCDFSKQRTDRFPDSQGGSRGRLPKEMLRSWGLRRNWLGFGFVVQFSR